MINDERDGVREKVSMEEDPIKYLAILVSRHDGDLRNLWGVQKKLSRDMAVYAILLSITAIVSVIFSAANFFTQ